jgi:hypothetical protein
VPPLLALGAAAIGGWYALKFARREMQRVGREVAAARRKPSGTLRRDPQTGRYTLKQQRED